MMCHHPYGREKGMEKGGGRNAPVSVTAVLCYNDQTAAVGGRTARPSSVGSRPAADSARAWMGSLWSSQNAHDPSTHVPNSGI